MKRLLLSCSFIVLLFASASAQFITVDAEKDAFYNTLTNPDDGKIFMPSKAYLRDVGTAATLHGDADLSGIIWTAWDETYIYYYAEITDDTVLVNNSSSSGSQWSNDKIEVKYDPDPNMADASTAVIQVGLSALGFDNAQDTAAVDNLDQDNDLQLATGTIWAATPDDYARKVTDNGYVLEFRIPFEYLNKGGRNFPFPPDAGMEIGSTINIADNDSVSRTNMLQWSAGFQDAAWSFPRLQGSMMLLEDHKIKFDATYSPNNTTIHNDSSFAWYFTPLTAVKPGENNTPESFNLSQNYPNPFNPSTVIRYNLDKESAVSITIYNLTGQVVKNLISNRKMNAGTNEVTWNAKDMNGSDVPSGVYFYQLKYGSVVSTKKMMLMR